MALTDPDQQSVRREFLVGCGVLAACSLLVGWAGLDPIVAALWHNEAGVWTGELHPVARALYRFGTWPAFVVTGVVTLGGAISARRPRPWFSGRLAAFTVALLLLGPGLLVNTLLKENYGRPRPRQVHQFGGELEFRPFWRLAWGGTGNSFPSGHASMGFFWLGYAVYFARVRPPLARGFRGLGLVHGSLMGIGRMAQGGHWLSDIVWSAGCVHLTAVALCWLDGRRRAGHSACAHELRPTPGETETHEPPHPRSPSDG
jgi:lipid A 4'-phosphatase